MTMEVQVYEIDLPIFLSKKTVKDTQILWVGEKIERFIKF
jgi:hypothetical protein